MKVYVELAEQRTLSYPEALAEVEEFIQKSVFPCQKTAAALVKQHIQHRYMFAEVAQKRWKKYAVIAKFYVTRFSFPDLNHALQIMLKMYTTEGFPPFCWTLEDKITYVEIRILQAFSFKSLGSKFHISPISYARALRSILQKQIARKTAQGRLV